jgi:hypothetical protein
MPDQRACPCSLCLALGAAIQREADALHLVEQTRGEVERAAALVDRRHHLPSAHADDWTAQSTARQPK